MTKLSSAKIEPVAKMAAVVAEALHTEYVTGSCTNSKRCLEQGQLKKNGERLGYADYKLKDMCRACEVFWLADMTKLRLQDLLKLALLEESGR